MDLHAWITRQVDRAEAAVHAELTNRQITFQLEGERALLGVITGVTRQSGGVQFNVAQYGIEPRDDIPAPLQQAVATLRRCEADRRILARHRLDPASAQSPAFAAACEGCGHEWVQDYCDPITDNLNECPELLDLAHAHGITPEELSELKNQQ